jgi:hypothetical protein
MSCGKATKPVSFMITDGSRQIFISMTMPETPVMDVDDTPAAMIYNIQAHLNMIFVCFRQGYGLCDGGHFLVHHLKNCRKREADEW